LTCVFAPLVLETPSTVSAQNTTAKPRLPGQVSNRPINETISTPYLFEKAREANGLEDYGLAEAFYQEILIREPSNVQAMLELANVYERAGKLEYARGLLNRSAQIEPGNKTILTKRATVERLLQIVLTEEVDSLVGGEHYELAIPKLSLQVSMQPENAELLYKKAFCYSKLGRFDVALADLEKALRIAHRDEYYELRGEILKSLKQKERGELIIQAKRLASSKSPANRGEARRILGEVLQVDPDNEWAKAELTRLSVESDTSVAVYVENSGERVETGDQPGFLTSTGRTVATLFGQHLGVVLLLLVIMLLFRSPLTSLILRSFFPHPVLSGSFSKFSFSEIVLMLNAEFHTGVMRVKGESCRGKIYFENGEPCHCIVGKLEGVEAVVHLLNNTAHGHFDFSDGSMPLNRTIKTPLSIILMEHANAPKAGNDAKPRSSNDHGRPGSSGQPQKKPKSRMRELLDSKTTD
jgi:hypothetical protein